MRPGHAMPRGSTCFPSLVMLRQERNHVVMEATSFLFAQRHVRCRNMAIDAAVHNSSDVIVIVSRPYHHRKK
jgi:hypothetical protein